MAVDGTTPSAVKTFSTIPLGASVIATPGQYSLSNPRPGCSSSYPTTAPWASPQQTSFASDGRRRQSMVTIHTVGVDGESEETEQEAGFWSSLTRTFAGLFNDRIEVTYTPRGKALGIFSRDDLVEARRIPSVVGSLVDTGCKYISLAWQSVCDAIRESAGWLTGSLIPTVSRAYSYMCGDPVDLEGGTARETEPLSGNLRVRAIDRTRRNEEEYRGRFTYEDILGARGYDADVLCQAMNSKFSVEKPRTRRDRKQARQENDWIEVFDVASDSSQDFDASYLLPVPGFDQYQIQSHCQSSKRGPLPSNQLGRSIDDWGSYEHQTATTMTG